MLFQITVHLQELQVLQDLQDQMVQQVKVVMQLPRERVVELPQVLQVLVEQLV
jgi:hypothetical protein